MAPERLWNLGDPLTKQLESAENLFDFFHDNIRTAHDEVQVDLDPDTVLYLANLLTDKARYKPTRPHDTTLAELHGRAAHSPPADRVRVYRELGDRALYQMGFFAESIHASVVSTSYYSEMGAAAYYQVDRDFRVWFADAFGPVFRELANRFLECVAIISHVRNHSGADHPDNLVRLYQKWLETGDAELLETLQQHGICAYKDSHHFH